MKKAIVITLTLSILLLLCACSADQKQNPSVLKPDNEQTQLAVPDSVGEGTKKEDTSGYAEERFVSANFDYVFTGTLAGFATTAFYIKRETALEVAAGF